MTEKSNHHKKLDIEHPSWLWFPLYEGMEPHRQWTEEKDVLARRIMKSFKNILDLYNKKIPELTEPNQHDYHGMYSQQVNQNHGKKDEAQA